MHRLVALLALTLTMLCAHAIGPDYWADWRTADTAHFRIHFRAENRAQAQEVARIAERVYPRITRQLEWEPRGRSELVLFNEFDFANGFSTPLPFNVQGIYLAVPDDGELLDNSTWIELVITHEFTHTVHMDKVRGAPRVLQAIFGRFPFFFPNVFQPVWALEGVAVFNETETDTGRGRLNGPIFEALLRIERAQGFKSLAELNADGRALPLSKQYLYGAYFFDYLARKYGRDALFKYVHNYSGNIVPRVHTNPYGATGKTMDALWDEFIADLGGRVDARIAALGRTARRDGDVLLPAQWNLHALAAAPDGAVFAVTDDGITRPRLTRIETNGRTRTLERVQRGAHLDVRGDGAVLVAQPEICDNYNLYYDLYEYTDARGLKRLTTCGRFRRAVWADRADRPDSGAVATPAAGTGAAARHATIVAIKNDNGRQSIVQLARDGKIQRTLVAAGDDFEPIDIAVSPDARRLAFIDKGNGRWRVFELDLAAAEAKPAEAKPAQRFARPAPLHSLRYSTKVPGALEFVAAHDGVFNVWRWSPTGELQRLTHTPTAVTLQGGMTADGALLVGVLAPGGVEVRRLASAAPTEAAARLREPAAAPVTSTPASKPEPADATLKPGQADLRDERGYLALRSMYPRSWFPVGYADRGLTAIGATTFGADSLRWHQYAATALWETSQGELLGALEYAFINRHFLSVTRELKATQWTGPSGNEETTEYERTTRAQWASTLPWLRLERRLRVGVGAAIDRTDRVRVAGGSVRPEDKRVAAVFFDYDTRQASWLSEGFNQGYRLGLLYETYRPFTSDGQNDFSGAVTRFDGQLFFPLGRTALAANYTEARANGNTERYQLGGATTFLRLLAPKLNDRDLALRGYAGDEAALRGRNARVGSLEWRTPVADIDRHAMVPPIGINRLSAAAFFDIGGAWDSGGKPAKYYRGIGVEALAEVRLLYALGLPVRVGIAQGLDDPGETRVYLQFGRQF